MKSKMGRPKLPKGQAKGEVIGARFSPSESKSIHDAIRKSNQTKPEWVRSVLLHAAGKN